MVICRQGCCVAQAENAELRQYERQMARDRSRGHFFQSLYEVKKEEGEESAPATELQVGLAVSCAWYLMAL